MKKKEFDVEQDYALWWLVISMRRAMYKARAKELFRYGLTCEEAAVLFAVSSIGDRATPAEIAR